MTEQPDKGPDVEQKAANVARYPDLGWCDRAVAEIDRIRAARAAQR